MSYKIDYKVGDLVIFDKDATINRISNTVDNITKQYLNDPFLRKPHKALKIEPDYHGVYGCDLFVTLDIPKKYELCLREGMFAHRFKKYKNPRIVILP